MIRFYVVRHGQTLFNQKDRVQGWCDSPLTSLGINQALATGIVLKDIIFHHAYTSISERAYDTAQAILKDKDTPITIDKRLKEFNFGTLEGEMNEVLFKPFNGNFELALKTGWVEFGGENEAMVRQRIRSFFNDITPKYSNENILITTHGLTALAILKEIVPNDFTIDKEIENCSITIIEYDGEYRLKELGNTFYRDEGLKYI